MVSLDGLADILNGPVFIFVTEEHDQFLRGESVQIVNGKYLKDCFASGFEIEIKGMPYSTAYLGETLLKFLDHRLDSLDERPLNDQAEVFL